jgi:hypothetical protein
MNISLSKKQKNIEKPKNEINSRRVWVRIYSVFTIFHLVMLVGLSYFFRELVRGIDAPVEALPQSNIAALEVLESKLSAIETRMDAKTHSLLEEVPEEEVTQVVVPVPERKEINKLKITTP